MSSSPFVFITSIPTLFPSIIFSTLFLFASCLHLYRILQTRRRVYKLLFIFSFLRAILFVIRIAWSQDQYSNKLAILSGIFTAGAFFIIILAIYILLEDWIFTLANTYQITVSNSGPPRRSAKLANYEQYILKTVECLLPAFSTLFVIGSIKEVNTDTSDSSIEKGDTIIKFSMICFLASVWLYMILVTYFAIKYSNRPIHKQLKVLVLYIIGALLLIELVYGTFMIFAPPTDKINKYSWVFYLFESLPEVLILAILGGVILGEWFFEDDDLELVDSIKTVSIGSIGNGSASV